MVTFASTVWSGSRWFCVLRFRCRKQTSFTAFLEPITLAPDVHRSRVMQQAIEDRGREQVVAKDAPHWVTSWFVVMSRLARS